jgi:nicotinamide mononucleotide transporter
MNSKWVFWEWLAVAFSLGFTYFIAEEYRWSWFLAGGASMIYIALVWKRMLWAETALHLFYGIMAIVGWLRWEESVGQTASEMTPTHHLVIIAGGALATVAIGFVLKKYSPAKTPYLDAFTTSFSILATLLMVGHFRENWLYWVAIDAASVGLYYFRVMTPSAIMYLLYTGLAIRGYIEWG